MKVVVLRIGHRGERDKRVTTHCALVARAFGASEIILSGVRDDKVMESVGKVCKKWGGNFKIKFDANWKRVIRNFKKKGCVVHLTMYGGRFDKTKIPAKNLLIVVGAEKVPADVYRLADFNVSIGNQPHSEIAALAIFLNKTFGNGVLYANFPHAKLKIVPSAVGKIVKKV